MKSPSLLENGLEIEGISWPDYTFMKVGTDGVTKIEVYPEPSVYGYMPYLAVYKGDKLRHVIPAPHVMVTFKEEDK